MTNEHEFGWEDEIQDDGSAGTLLPPGDYDFVVTKFERARHNGSEKLPPCNKAVIYMEVGPQSVEIKHNLFLHTKTEGLLCEFFRSIGHRRHGEALQMNWAMVPGSTGRCRVAHRTYNNEKYNDVKKFLDPPAAASQPPQQATQQRPQQQSQRDYEW